MCFRITIFVKPQDIFIKNGVYIGTYPLKIALLGGIVGFVITYIAFKIIKNKATKEEMIYKLKIKINDKTVEVNALLDTGNKLKDPITLVPVIVIEKQKLYNFLPEEILENIDKIIGGDSNKLIEENIKYMSKFRVIPYNSIGKQNGLMLGFKADEVKIIIDEEERTIKNTIIGIFNQSFNSQTYSALISLEIIE